MELYSEMNEQRVMARNVSMYPEDWAVVWQVAKDTGQSASGGLRLIIREYVALKMQELKASNN